MMLLTVIIGVILAVGIVEVIRLIARIKEREELRNEQPKKKK